MPGLLRGVARTAVVAGTATAVSNRVSRRQANRWSSQDEQAAYEQQQYAQPQPAPAPAAPAVDPIAQLKELASSTLKASSPTTSSRRKRPKS